MIDKYLASKYGWGEGCESFVLLDTEALSVKQETMPANTREQLHFHSKAQQFFYVLEGTARFCVEENIITVGRHQGLHIVPGKKHFIENNTEWVLEFLVVSQPDTRNDRKNVGD